MPVTKHNWLISDPADIPRVIREAFHVATTGRPGPVLVDFPKDIANMTMEWYWPERVDLPGYKPTVKGHPKQIKDAARLIQAATRPVIYAGGGILKANASPELRELAELANLPVVTTLMARGAMPDAHPLCLGMPGMHGNYTAVTSMQKSDLLIALGSRFDDRVTGDPNAFAPDAKVIHVDIDPAELGKVRRPDVPIVGDAKSVITELIKAVAAEHAKHGAPDTSAWITQLDEWQERFPLKYQQLDGGPLKPQFVVESLRANTPDDCILVAGVGQHQMWAAHFVGYEQPRKWINSGGLGTMGFAVPAAMGAKVGCPDQVVWAIDGDGCFQMTNQELATCAINNIPIKVAIINNESLGMVRQWQTLFYNSRYSNTDLESKRIPDFVKLAEAYGCVGLSCDSPEDVDATITKAMEINDVPVVVDFRVHRDAMVWPMVAAGTSNDEIKYARDLAPRFEDDADLELRA
jgi:acetolactate synthase-1/2/3 large subunit